jgi:methionyl-tRNA synthetase
VAKFLQQLRDDGHIYEGEYEGYYCVGCEEYKQLDDLMETEVGDYAGQKLCKIHSLPVEVLREKNYFFRMSDFEQQLLDLYESQPDFVQPESVRNEILQFVKQGLDDLSISRSTFDWGVKVPWDHSHVVYVWFDALLNYVSAVGYGEPDAEAQATFRRRWPAYHLVGKDIARFHAVIWPAMLMAAGLPVPHRVFGHGWLLVGGEKMSKSKLTGIAPEEITDVFGSDAFRYYFLRAITFGQDGSFSWEDLSARYNAELANGFGNLASRVIAMVGRYFDGGVPSAPQSHALLSLAEQVTAEADDAIERFAINEAIAKVWTLVDELNGFITDTEPWQLAKDPAKRSELEAVLAVSVRVLGTIGVLLSPVMPQATGRLWVALGGTGDIRDQDVRRAWEWSGGDVIAPLDGTLFPRIEEPVISQEPGASQEAVTA